MRIEGKIMIKRGNNKGIKKKKNFTMIRGIFRSYVKNYYGPNSVKLIQFD
jgi:hypothetical protein